MNTYDTNTYDTDTTEQRPLMLTLCLEEESILVSSAVLDYLGHPQQIQMLVNDKSKMLLLRPCGVEAKEAIVIPSYPLIQFEMSGYSLIKRIRRMTDWENMQPRVIYGVPVPGHMAVTFDLKRALPAKLRMFPEMMNPFR